MIEVGKYNIGLDIGTNSLGWAVADSSGKLIPYKKNPMIGTVLLQEEGKTAAERRGFRSARRRLVRRRQRIAWLQDLMFPMFEKDDPDFFQRLKYSYVSKEDDSCEISPNILFDDSYYKTHAYHEEFPTIYHLRKHLASVDEPIDLRLVYLAIHHIIKYRGNFLYEGQDISVKNLNLTQSIREMIEALEIPVEEDDDSLAEAIRAEIIDFTKRKGERRDGIVSLLQDYAPEDVEKPKNWAKAIASLIMGYTADISLLFDVEEKKVSFSDEKYIEAEELLSDEQIIQFESIQKVYSGQVLTTILSGSVSTISDAYISVYDSHHKDIATLKKVLKKYSKPSVYENLINSKAEKVKSYANYIDSTKACSNEDLCKVIKKELDAMPQDDSDVVYCLSRIKDEQFLLKPRNNNNGVIPNQLHCEELELILDNQSKYYPYLSEIKDKILSIASFRIPYFVGPLSTNDERHWVVRSKDKIVPWNFSEVVNYNETAERFIKRLTNKCTYLTNEPVLPKNSLLYSEYSVLAELSNVYVNGKHLSPECKCAAVEELFKKHKTVSRTLFRNWYKNKYLPGVIEDPELSGLSDESKFISNLASYIDMTKILGPIDSETKYNTVEKVIEFITIFEDRAIRKEKIMDVLPKSIPEAKIKELLHLSYRGWGRFSKKLLDGLYSNDENGFPITVMGLLRTTEQNFMQILFNPAYDFEFLISAENKKNTSNENNKAKDIILNYPGSPAIKKVTLVATKVIAEIEEIVGHEPSNIFVEVASGSEEKKRTISRYKRIEQIYANIADSSFNAVYQELKSYKDSPKELDKRAVYLYFLQNGKCLYSGDPLDLRNLSNYQIDHILPRCYVKDDSFDNLALVKTKENQRKLDSRVLDDSIINSQKARWESLLKNNLMSRKKFDNLCRRVVDEKAFDGFINRQLVETRQICTNVFNSMKAVYSGKVKVYGVSAKLSNNIKNRIGVLKIREINDFHHAVDAYTALLAGMFSQRLPRGGVKKLFDDIKDKDEESGRENNKYGLLAEFFCQEFPWWNGSSQTWAIRKCSNSHNFYINCLVEEQTDNFYDQTLQRKTYHPSKNLVPKKRGMNTELYGGYTGSRDAYYCVVKDNAETGRKAYSIIGIPIRVVSLQKQNPSAIIDYLKEKGVKDPLIVKDKIKKYQHILYSDHGSVDEYYMDGAGEVINAKQLWLTEKSKRVLDKLLNAPSKIGDDDYYNILYLYDELCERILKYYPCYKTIGEACFKYKSLFMKLPVTEKAKHILNILTALHANTKMVPKPNWERVDEYGNNVGFVIPSSRLRKVLKPENITFVDSSITGMFVRSYKLGI